MAALPLPPKQTATREVVLLARNIERYSAQRRKLLFKVRELEGNIRSAKTLLRQLVQSLAVPELGASSSEEPLSGEPEVVSLVLGDGRVLNLDAPSS